MATALFEKTPEGELDYTENWSDWLTGGEQIVSCDWKISPSDGAAGELVFFDQAEQLTSVTVWLKDGVVGTTYTITGTITTDNAIPRISSRSFLVTILENRFLEGS